MTANHEHTPIGVHQEVLQAYIAQGGTIERFYEWFDATQARAERRGRNEERENIAAAEQRGAVKALRDAATAIEKNNIVFDGDHYQPCNSCMSIHMNWLDYRADLLEGDDE